jgi:hypothetical protein
MTAIANAILPSVACVAIARLGPPGIWLGMGVVLTADAVVRIATNKSRGDFVRALAVPALVRAEICTTGSCGLVSPQATWLMLVLGVACLAAFRHELERGDFTSPAWVALQLVAVTAVSGRWAIMSVRARHEKLAFVARADARPLAPRPDRAATATARRHRIALSMMRWMSA